MSGFDDWVGRERVERDRVDLRHVRALAATLDQEPEGIREGDPLPPGWHWILFRPLPPASAIAPDGHERKGEFLPPLPLPRRMWAGGALRFFRDLRVGETVERRSRIEAIQEKEGRSGRMAFVTVRHELRSGGALALEEDQHLVYLPARTGPDATPPPPAPTGAGWSESRETDEVLLFRFSALTFNGHRIHYDERYVREVEHYPGLVVHGPLLALLLLDAAARREESGISAFQFRGRSPLICGVPFRLEGGGTGEGGEGSPGPDGPRRVWAASAEGALLMEATVLPEGAVARSPSADPGGA